MMDPTATSLSADGSPLFKVLWLTDSGEITIVPTVFTEDEVSQRISWAQANGYQVEETCAGVVMINPGRDQIWLYTKASQ